jgi:hypothetical protein
MDEYTTFQEKRSKFDPRMFISSHGGMGRSESAASVELLKPQVMNRAKFN